MYTVIFLSKTITTKIKLPQNILLHFEHFTWSFKNEYLPYILKINISQAIKYKCRCYIGHWLLKESESIMGKFRKVSLQASRTSWIQTQLVLEGCTENLYSLSCPASPVSQCFTSKGKNDTSPSIERIRNGNWQRLWFIRETEESACKLCA